MGGKGVMFKTHQIRCFQHLHTSVTVQSTIAPTVGCAGRNTTPLIAGYTDPHQEIVSVIAAPCETATPATCSFLSALRGHFPLLIHRHLDILDLF